MHTIKPFPLCAALMLQLRMYCDTRCVAAFQCCCKAGWLTIPNVVAAAAYRSYDRKFDQRTANASSSLSQKSDRRVNRWRVDDGGDRRRWPVSIDGPSGTDCPRTASSRGPRIGEAKTASARLVVVVGTDRVDTSTDVDFPRFPESSWPESWRARDSLVQCAV